jgi:hypothetical protein
MRNHFLLPVHLKKRHERSRESVLKYDIGKVNEAMFQGVGKACELILYPCASKKQIWTEVMFQKANGPEKSKP